MERLAEAILLKTNELSEGAPVSAKMFLHLGTRAAVDQPLSRLARSGKLLRGDGAFTCPRSKAGLEPIRPWRSVWSKGLRCNVANHRPVRCYVGERLGLTTQVPVRTVYWTSGRSRKLNLGKQCVELVHVPSW